MGEKCKDDKPSGYRGGFHHKNAPDQGFQSSIAELKNTLPSFQTRRMRLSSRKVVIIPVTTLCKVMTVGSFWQRAYERGNYLSKLARKKKNESKKNERKKKRKEKTKAKKKRDKVKERGKDHQFGDHYGYHH